MQSFISHKNTLKTWLSPICAISVMHMFTIDAPKETCVDIIINRRSEVVPKKYLNVQEWGAWMGSKNDEKREHMFSWESFVSKTHRQNWHPVP